MVMNYLLPSDRNPGLNVNALLILLKIEGCVAVIALKINHRVSLIALTFNQSNRGLSWSLLAFARLDEQTELIKLFPERHAAISLLKLIKKLIKPCLFH